MSAKVIPLHSGRAKVRKTVSRQREVDLTGVEVRENRIRITFVWQGKRCRETLNIPFSQLNLKFAAQLRSKILAEIAAGVFRYGDHFPESVRAQQLGITPPASMLFQEYADRWINSKDDISKGVLQDYRSMLARYWAPKLGHLRADQLQKSIIDEAIGTIQWQSAKHRNDALIPLRAVLTVMFLDEAIPRDLAALIKNKKRQKPVPNPLTPEEVDRVLLHLEAAFGVEKRNIFEVAFFTGVRPGELIALHWTDLDVDRKVLTVRRSWGDDQDDIEREEDSTKTFRTRDIELNERALGAFARQRPLTCHGEVVFLTSLREPYTSSARLRRLNWMPTLSALNIPSRHMYQTRHTFATMNIMAGANPYWVAEQLGHGDAQLLFTTYSKWLKGAAKVHQPTLLDDWLARGAAPILPQGPTSGNDS